MRAPSRSRYNVATDAESPGGMHESPKDSTPPPSIHFVTMQTVILR